MAGAVEGLTFFCRRPPRNHVGHDPTETLFRRETHQRVSSHRGRAHRRGAPRSPATRPLECARPGNRIDLCTRFDAGFRRDLDAHRSGITTSGQPIIAFTLKAFAGATRASSSYVAERARSLMGRFRFSHLRHRRTFSGSDNAACNRESHFRTNKVKRPGVLTDEACEWSQ